MDYLLKEADFNARRLHSVCTNNIAIAIYTLLLFSGSS
jgi:hypothetical protein